MLHLISEVEFKKKTAYYSIAYKAVLRSKFLDEKWYLNAYPEVNKSKLSAIDHYIELGFKSGYNPSKDFDAKKTFFSQIPEYFYGLQSSKAIKNAHVAHKKECKIENFKKEQRKVLLISHELSLTGAPRALFNVAKILKDKGFEPVVLSPAFGELEKELVQNNIEYYIEPLLLVKLLFQCPVTKDFFQSFETIFFNTLPSLRFAPYIVSKNKKIAWIHEARLAFEREEVTRDFVKLFENIDEVYSVGMYSKSFTDKYIDKNKSHILLYGIDEIDIANLPEKTEEKLVFAIVGLCSERKGHDIFVQAIQKLPKEVRENSVFEIIGNIDKRKFSQKIKSIAGQEGIFCTGQLSYKETINEMNKIDCLVCPSIDDPMPMVCTEAMMLEKVVLTSSSTGTAYFIDEGKNGFVFEADADALKDCICRVYGQKQELKSIGKNARKIYERHFKQDVFVKDVVEIF